MPDRGTIAMYETAVRQIQTALVEQVRRERELLGARPFGYFKGQVWEQLERYLDVRDDPQVIFSMMDAKARELGWDPRYVWTSDLAWWDQAIGEMAADLKRLEEELDRRGGWEAVRYWIREQGRAAAEQAAKLAQKYLDAPKLVLLPPLPQAARETDPVTGMAGFGTPQQGPTGGE